ncbi:MAG TPA: hypothetical protein DCM54_13370 [Gammaproteobacteria bacterium]|nr:hypothetical protein [Gammaproteobacteria bacterium]|tara:strand:- start:90 stop:1112 length:1023 start_codon:yes stop_codon:yes gene_type:complete
MALRIGLIGAGGNTKFRHIPGFQEIDGVKVVAVCNRSTASAQKVADQFGIERVVERVDDIINDDDIDAICVGTWPYMHHDLTIATLKAGKHILTEARMAMNLAEARAMLVAAEASDKVSMIVPAPRNLKHEATVLEMLEAGFFGDLLEIHVTALSGQYDPDAPIHWRNQRELSGNNIMSMGIQNETVRRYAGHEKSVIAYGSIFTRERIDSETGETSTVDVPESLGVIAEHESGATAVYHLSNVAHLGYNNMAFFGTKASLKYEGNDAYIATNEDKTWQPLEVDKDKEGGWRVEQEFVEAILEGKPVTHTNFADGVRYMEFTEAVQISIQEGRRVDLPLD